MDGEGNVTMDDGELETSFAAKMVLVSMLSIFSVVGTVGNAVAFYIFFRRREKSTSTVFILTLAGTDFFTCLIIIPYTVAYELVEGKLVYDIVCKLYMFFITSNIPFSAFIMVAIAFDRYFCICHPFLHAFTVKRVKVVVLCLFLLAFTFGVITALASGVYQLGKIPGNLTEMTSLNGSTNGDAVLYSTGSEKGNVAHFTAEVGSGVSNATVKPTMTNSILYDEYCYPNEIIFSGSQIEIYQKVYTAFFVISFISVAILYILIYKSILMRRSKKAKRKKTNHYHSVGGAEKSALETQTTALNGNSSTKEPQTQTRSQHLHPNRASIKRISTIRDTNLYANIKTAIMLFVVTVVFIIAFLPSWLMAHRLLPMNLLVFNMYYLYNVANPVIYAFMNQSFRDDLKRLLRICK